MKPKFENTPVDAMLGQSCNVDALGLRHEKEDLAGRS